MSELDKKVQASNLIAEAIEKIKKIESIEEELMRASPDPRIKDDIMRKYPDSKVALNNQILKTLFDLGSEANSQQLSDSEFFDIVGETFKLNPEYFMKELYKRFMKKMSKIIGAEKQQEMVKYIIENFCLVEDEQIVYECKANVNIFEKSSQIKFQGYKITISSGYIYITNFRIIAQGSFKVEGGQHILTPLLFTPRFNDLSGYSRRKERKIEFIESSPTFGYQFPCNDHYGLAEGKHPKLVSYTIMTDERYWVINITPTDKSKKEKDITKIFDILAKM